MTPEKKSLLRGLAWLLACIVAILSPFGWLFLSFFALYGKDGWWVAPSWCLAIVFEVVLLIVAFLGWCVVVLGLNEYRKGLKKPERPRFVFPSISKN